MFDFMKQKQKPAVPVNPERPPEIIRAEENLDRKKVGTVIGEGTSFSGEIDTTIGVIISGDFKGKIRAVGENVPVIIKSSGTVEGEIVADLVFLSGTAHANINAQTLAIYACAKFAGNIVAKNLGIESGAALCIESCISDGHAKVEVPPQIAGEGTVRKVSFTEGRSNAA